MDDDYKKAIDMIDGIKVEYQEDEKEKEEKKNPEPEIKPDPKIVKTLGKTVNLKKKKKTLIGYAIIITLIIVLFFVVVLMWNEDRIEATKIIDEIKAMNLTIDPDAEIVYRNIIENFDNNWVRIDVKINYFSEPWRSYEGYFWYNTVSKDYEIVPK